MRLQSLGHVVLKVRDLNRSVAFYRDVLGLKEVGKAGEKMVFFSFAQSDSRDRPTFLDLPYILSLSS